jgi:hypothetical protein
MMSAVIYDIRSGRTVMASLVLQYDRPTSTQHWHEYNRRVRDWIARLLQLPGAVSFMAHRAVDGVSPDTMTVLDFRTVDEARSAAKSDQVKAILEELRATGTNPQIRVFERSPFTPEPIHP